MTSDGRIDNRRMGYPGVNIVSLNGSVRKEMFNVNLRQLGAGFWGDWVC